MLFVICSINFNSQPREGGWVYAGFSNAAGHDISTHSRAKAAGAARYSPEWLVWISTHSRAKAAGGGLKAGKPYKVISTHSRAKAAGSDGLRRGGRETISTHSRAKAAGRFFFAVKAVEFHFNSQPREGGWPTVRPNQR